MTSDPISFRRLIDIGIALSAEKDTNTLMERILLEAKDIGNADGGTLYIRTKDDKLKFEILRNDTLGTAQGGTTGEDITLPPVDLYTDEGTPNEKNVASYAALHGVTINIPDAYDEEDQFDFSGTQKFDEATGFRSKSFLTVPLMNNANEVIGVLQLLNSIEGGDVVPFSDEVTPLIEALASQAAVALDNALLIEAQKNLLQSFIELMAGAVDAKSPYTGGHCQRVPELTEMLTRAVCDSREGPYAEFNLTDEDWYELHIGAWLHDCGKVTTPEYVVDKATKLETITDRIHEIRTRFEVVKREAEIACLEAIIAGGNEEEIRAGLAATLAEIDDDYEFIARCNVGGEFMADEDIDRVKAVAERTWVRTLDDRIGISNDEMQRKQKAVPAKLPATERLLADREDHLFQHEGVVHSADPDNPYGFQMEVPAWRFNKGEVYNLCIRKGTLTEEERFKIQDHIVQTIVMLESLPFPKHLENVPEIAGGHHEQMNGNGYPKKLKGDEMSVPARVMAIADVFEALTAADRPYKEAKTLSESIRIMSFMVKDEHLDGSLFRIFLESGVYQDYADRFLLPSQVDEVDVSSYLQAG